MDLDPIRQALEHLDAAQNLIEHYNRGPRTAAAILASEASCDICTAFHYLEGLLEIEEPRRAAVHVAKMALEGAEGAQG